MRGAQCGEKLSCSHRNIIFKKVATTTILENRLIVIFNSGRCVVNNVFCYSYVYINSYGIIKVMKEIVDILVILLAAITSASLQLGTGTLLLLYHESLGRRIPKKTKRITRGYIFGAFLFLALGLAATALIILVCNGSPLGENGMVILVSLAIVMALLVLLFYYRKGKNTMLWVPDWVAKYLKKRAVKADSGAEAIALGMMTAFGELPFSIVLILIAANSLLSLPRAVIIIALVGYAMIGVMPLIITKMVIKNGKNLVAIQKWRIENKMFFRVFTGICYLVIAAFLVAFKMIGV